LSEPWATLYGEVWEELVRFLDRKVWDMEQARDLAQEAFVRALRTDPVPDSPRAWLFTVAANLARDEARSAIRRRQKLQLLRASAGEEAAGPAEVLEAKRRREQVRKALGALNERERNALLLCEAGLSYSEIADATGLAVGAVGTTLSRARRKLASAFDTLSEGEDSRAAP
jgi:RNA polymerase sigma-70 factor (ECF subfamily)